MTIEGWGIIIYTIAVVGIALAYSKVSHWYLFGFFFVFSFFVVNRIFMIVFGILACYCSIKTESLLDLMIFVSNMLTCSFPVFFAAYCWNRFNVEGALVGLIAGGTTALLWMFVPSLRSIMPTLWAGVIVTAVTMVLVTFLTKPSSKENLITLQILKRRHQLRQRFFVAMTYSRSKDRGLLLRQINEIGGVLSGCKVF